MSFQDDTGDFTMVSHQLAAKVGLVCAAVYGAVWRYCNMKEGNCRASYGTIGENINVDRRTVIRSIEKLCRLGYLVDTTPDCRHAPHAYIIGKTVSQNNNSGVTESHPHNENGVTESHPKSTVGVTESHWGSDTESLLGVTESHPNRDINRDSNRELKPSPKPHKIPAVQIFVEVTEKYCLTKPQMRELDEIIGDNQANLDKWRDVVKAWSLAGYKLTNITGQLEWFKNGIPSYKNINGNHDQKVSISAK